MEEKRIAKCPRNIVGKKVSGSKKKILDANYGIIRHAADSITAMCIDGCSLAFGSGDKSEMDCAEDLAMGVAMMEAFLSNVSARRRGRKKALSGTDICIRAERIQKRILRVAKKNACRPMVLV